jgi:prevent-host-death family protein
MGITKSFRPISYLKSNTADVAKEIAETSSAVVITQNGLPAFVCVSMEEYYQTQETNALVKLINMGKAEAAKGRVHSLTDARAVLDQRILGRQIRKN